MNARHTPATAALQRRFERWELQHLRLLARQHAEQIEELQRRAAWAEDCAERWRDDALDMQEQLADTTGGQPGLTQEGRLVVAEVALLPAIGEPWPGIEGSLYAGAAAAEGDQPDGHLVLLPDLPAGMLAWQGALDWAAGLGNGAHLPTRTESALLYANLRDQLDRDNWHWTSTPHERDGSCAWSQHFTNGLQYYGRKSFEGRCRAVRRFDAQSFNPSKGSAS